MGLLQEIRHVFTKEFREETEFLDRAVDMARLRPDREDGEGKLDRMAGRGYKSGCRFDVKFEK